MTEQTNIELAKRVLELAEKATPGPWAWDVAPIGVRGLFSGKRGVVSNWLAYVDEADMVVGDADAEFIAQARTLMPELAKRLLEAEEELVIAYRGWRLDTRTTGDD